MVRHQVKNQVVTLPTFGEVLLGVINHAIRTDRSHHVHIPRTANAGNICAERLGDLHRKRTDTSRRTVNQDFLPRLNLSLVAKTLQSSECCNSYRSALLKRHVVWLYGQSRLGSTRILGKGPTARTEHRVA